MPKDKTLTFKELTTLIKERSQKPLEEFGQVLVSGVNHPELLSVLVDIKDYWKDTLRPALISFCCEAVGGRPDATDDLGLMVTLIAAGMGVHDDIIDKSSNKHFRMTIVGLHSADYALVVGDLLIVKALTAIREIAKKNCTPEKTEKIIQVYEAAFVEMCEGEFMEISCRKNLDVELEYYKQVLWKFGSDTEVCSRLGAILGNGSAQETQALSEFGRRFGFLSRLSNDMRDCLNLEGNLPQRLEHESVPLPILYAAKSSKEGYSKINSIIRKSTITPTDVERLLELCFKTEAFAYVLDMAKQTAQEANHSLRLIRHCSARNALELMLQKALADVKNLCL